MIADKGFSGRDYQTRLDADGTTLLTPSKTRTAANLARERALASTRLVIESVFSNLKEQMRLERHLARTAGLAVRIASASSRSPSASCSTPSPAAPHAPSPPTTADKSHQASSRARTTPTAPFGFTASSWRQNDLRLYG